MKTTPLILVTLIAFSLDAYATPRGQHCNKNRAGGGGYREGQGGGAAGGGGGIDRSGGPDRIVGRPEESSSARPGMGGGAGGGVLPPPALSGGGGGPSAGGGAGLPVPAMGGGGSREGGSVRALPVLAAPQSVANLSAKEQRRLARLQSRVARLNKYMEEHPNSRLNPRIQARVKELQGKIASLTQGAQQNHLSPENLIASNNSQLMGGAKPEQAAFAEPNRAPATYMPATVNSYELNTPAAGSAK